MFLCQCKLRLIELSRSFQFTPRVHLLHRFSFPMLRENANKRPHGYVKFGHNLSLTSDKNQNIYTSPSEKKPQCQPWELGQSMHNVDG